MLADAGTAKTAPSSGPHDSHAQAVQASEAAGAERRHLTVLFCDIVDSTATAASLDPEDWQNLVAEYREVVGKAVKLFDGTVIRYLGDGICKPLSYHWFACKEQSPENIGRSSI